MGQARLRAKGSSPVRGIYADALGIKPEMQMMPMQPGDVPATYADIDRIHKKLGYKPTTPISEGIPKFIDWYKQYHKIN